MHIPHLLKSYAALIWPAITITSSRWHSSHDLENFLSSPQASRSPHPTILVPEDTEIHLTPLAQNTSFFITCTTPIIPQCARSVPHAGFNPHGGIKSPPHPSECQRLCLQPTANGTQHACASPSLSYTAKPARSHLLHPPYACIHQHVSSTIIKERDRRFATTKPDNTYPCSHV